jgi:CspA family cold shock protein
MTAGDVRPEMDKSARKGVAPGRTTGVVKSYNPKRNPFGGYITDDKTGVDVFVHKSAVDEAKLGALSPSQKLEFDIVEDGFGGFKAAKLRQLE